MRHVNYIYQNPLETLIDTAHLRRKLDHLRQERDHFRRDRYLRHYFSDAIKTLTRRLKAAVKSNAYIRTKWEMLLDPVRRMQILFELGGEEALQRWEARRVRVLEARRKKREARKRSGRKPNRSARMRHGDRRPMSSVHIRKKEPRIRTDRSGIFYLAPAVAPILKGRYTFRPYDPSCAKRRRERPLRIPLRPEELRGEVLIGLGIMPDGGETKSDQTPPDTDRIIRLQIENIKCKALCQAQAHAGPGRSAGFAPRPNGLGPD